MGDTILEKYEERKAELRTVNKIFWQSPAEFSGPENSNDAIGILLTS